VHEKSPLDSTTYQTSSKTSEKYKLEKQYIGLYSDSVSIAHSTKSAAGSTLKYPTNYASFESLFQNSRTRDLISTNDPNVNTAMFSNTPPNSGNGNGSNMEQGFTLVSNTSPSSMTSLSPGGSSPSANATQLITVPMIAIGIKSKFNTKSNTKQLLVALNFNNLTLNHLFTTQPDFWICQLIQLFDLVDIDVLGYEVPLVITELHLNVHNSCVLYQPVHLATRAVVTFKSLHWSSNVTPESSLTLLVFNIDDIFLFLSKLVQPQNTG
jgi:hypothetical protein